jgi:diguanylate cyclase (GGDEF)-like protein
MTTPSIPVIVLSSQQDDAESINRILREAGHAAHCYWLKHIEGLSDTINKIDAQLLWLFCDHFDHDISTVANVRTRLLTTLPLIAVKREVSEEAAAKAMCDGANDLISIVHRERVRHVAERELRAFRLQRALNTTLHSAKQYKDQLQSFTATSDDAIAHVSEGILIEANAAWGEVFRREPDDMIGPLMDLFDPVSHAVVKGAIVASQKGQWTTEPIKVVALGGSGEKHSLEMTLEAAVFDGEPAIKLGILREPEESQEPLQLVERAISTDPSTGLYHRRKLVEALAERLALSGTSGTRALALIRPDNFGEVSEKIGPLASEEVLVELAEILRSCAHAHDVYGRFGGTVFAMWLERGTLRDIEAWAESVVEQIASHIFECEKKTLSLTCTIGLADAGPNVASLSELFRGAQRANQRGRQRGGSQIVLEETSDASTRVQRFDQVWVQQIKSALVENRFQLARLSIASLHGESRPLFDSVIKMIDVQGEEVPAATFLPVAARNNLLRAVDRWVVDAAVKAVADRPEDRLFVKLSGESIVDSDFMSWLTRCVQASRIVTHQLCFQVPEETITQHLKQAIDIARNLRSAGFGFAIEHFGIGRAPIRLLTQIQMDYLKLDGSLMQGLGESQSQQTKVREFITAADAQGIKTVAERVEDANTMAVLFQLGIGYVQGHYVHEPEVILEDVV